MTGKRKKGRSAGGTIGAIIVGFDQQIFYTMPPVQELIVKGQPVRGLSGQGKGDLQVVFPGDVIEPPVEPDAEPPELAAEPPAPLNRSPDAEPPR